jgi:hypothetical protein
MVCSCRNARPTGRRLGVIIVLIIMVNFMLGEMFTLAYWAEKFRFTDAEFFMNRRVVCPSDCLAQTWVLHNLILLHPVALCNLI